MPGCGFTAACQKHNSYRIAVSAGGLNGHLNSRSPVPNRQDHCCVQSNIIPQPHPSKPAAHLQVTLLPAPDPGRLPAVVVVPGCTALHGVARLVLCVCHIVTPQTKGPWKHCAKHDGCAQNAGTSSCRIMLLHHAGHCSTTNLHPAPAAHWASQAPEVTWNMHSMMRGDAKHGYSGHLPALRCMQRA